MINVDVICLTNTVDINSFELTKRTIDSIFYSEKTITFNIILIESNPNSLFTYDNVSHYIKPNISFNYNKYLNIASEYLTSDWVLITNNDVRYEKNWFSEIIKVYTQDTTIESFSPKEILFYSTIYADHFGSEHCVESAYWVNYKVSEGLFGWSLVMKKRVWDLIYPWDEQFDFYYQDNDYSKIIESLGIKHALVRDSLTLHLGNLSLLKNKYNSEKQKKMDYDYKKFIKKWGN
jgi:GT2 family glycosyltransferase